MNASQKGTQHNPAGRQSWIDLSQFVMIFPSTATNLPPRFPFCPSRSPAARGAVCSSSRAHRQPPARGREQNDPLLNMEDHDRRVIVAKGLSPTLGLASFTRPLLASVKNERFIRHFNVEVTEKRKKNPQNQG